MSNRAWVTLVTNDSYGLGALVLAHSIVRAGSTYPAVVLVTPNVTDPMRERLREVFADVITVDVLDSRDAAHLALLQRPELGITFTKLHCWSLTQYEKCVFLDADTLILQNCDELFEREELSAAPDVGWPDCFNSGVFVFRPSQETFDALIKFAQERGSFDGGDQGLLNSFFADWAHGDINKHLPFLYNVTSAAFYSYLPAFKQFGENMKIIHFIGPAKPWLQQYNWDTNTVDAPDHLRNSLQQWWEIFKSSVHRQLDTAMVQDKTQEEVHFELNLPIEDIEPQNESIYEPETNPSSEFPWHRPETINVQEKIESVDSINFHDPWKYYKGNVPLPESNNLSHENVQSIRTHVWEYQKHGDNISNQPWHTENAGNNNNNHWDRQIMDNLNYHHEEWQSHGNKHHYESNVHVNNHQQGWHDHGINHQTVYHSVESQSFHTSNDHSQHLTLPSHKENNDNNNKLNNNQQNDQNHTHDSFNICISDVNIKQNKHSPKPKRKARHRHTHIHHWKKCLINGHGHDSDSESDSETVIPRHPYDGFYLLHQVTVDSRGRKMCTHEMLSRQTSKTSKNKSEQKIESIEAKRKSDEDNGIDTTGVAGNLARVVPGTGSGSSSEQREAVGELSRRQGWETGNIDYLGADSFDNIWAKISNTLNETKPEPQTDSLSPPINESSPSKDQTDSPAPKQEEKQEISESRKEIPSNVVVETQATESVKDIPSSIQILVPQLPSESSTISINTQDAELPAEPIPLHTESPDEAISVKEQDSVTEGKIEEPIKESSFVKESSTVEETTLPGDIVEPESKDATDVFESTPSIISSNLEKIQEPISEVASMTASVSDIPSSVKSVNETLEAELEQVAGLIEGIKLELSSTKTPPSTPQTTPDPEVATLPIKEETVLLAEDVVASIVTTEKSIDPVSSTDSPPLATTPAKEGTPPTNSKSPGERRVPAMKLLLNPSDTRDTLPTPDSEMEDAASIAQSIIASELNAPLAERERSLSVDDSPPVSLAQIGVKSKPSTAAQIESSLDDTKPLSSLERPKKKALKKVPKKEVQSGSDAPVPPPRKKEKKSKDK